MPLLQTLAALGVKWPCAASSPPSSDVDPALEVLAELLGEKGCVRPVRAVLSWSRAEIAFESHFAKGFLEHNASSERPWAPMRLLACLFYRPLAGPVVSLEPLEQLSLDGLSKGRSPSLRTHPAEPLGLAAETVFLDLSLCFNGTVELTAVESAPL